MFGKMVADYHCAHLQEALYERRALVEYFDKNLCVLPAEEWPCLARMRAALERLARMNGMRKVLFPRRESHTEESTCRHGRE